jgi:hypothetical protein
MLGCFAGFIALDVLALRLSGCGDGTVRMSDSTEGQQSHFICKVR